MSKYFSYLPNIRVGVPEKENSLKNYIEVKNLFRRVKFAAASARNLTYFEKYSIPGDDKPYNVSYTIYGTPDYEWIILLLNDITNVYKQWPLSQREFELMIHEKYNLNGVNGELNTHHWETSEVKNLKGDIIVPAGMVVNEDFTKLLPNGNILAGDDIVTRVTNYEYEYRLNEEKRDIYLPYPDTIFSVMNELQSLLQYYESIDTQTSSNMTKNSGDEDFYNFKYFNVGITK